MTFPIVFDLDGTLIDSLPDIRAAALEAFDPLGITPVTMAEIHEFTGNGVAHFITRLIETRALAPETRPDLMARFLTCYPQHQDLTTLYPCVRTTLTALRAQGHPLGLCTNKPEVATRAVLKHFDLPGMFEILLFGDSLPERKPHPAPLHAALAGCGGGPGLYVGDSEVDADTAHAANVPFALFTSGYLKRPLADTPHQYAFADFTDLLTIVNSHQP